MESIDKQTLLRSGVTEVGSILNEISISVNDIFENVSKQMRTLQGESLFLGEASDILLERYSNFEKEFPRFVREIQNYSQFMVDTLVSYQDVDKQIERDVSLQLNHQIEELTDAGNIGDNVSKE